MKVKELIEKLKEQNQELDVCFWSNETLYNCGEVSQQNESAFLEELDDSPEDIVVINSPD